MTISFNSLGNLGHLGNQMFQYASLKGIATSNNTDFMIPPKEKFSSTYQLLSNINECFDLNCQRGISNFQVLKESSFSYDSNFMKEIGDVDLYGYFQTEKYFKHIEDEIRKEFSFSEHLVDVCSNFIEGINSQRNVISIHIRRKDYLNLQLYHPVCPLEYYEQALKKFPEFSVLVFSDDPDWCMKQNLFNSDKFLVSQSNSPYVDMCIMSMCSHHIISNSSFSWWGAWLSASYNVIAPKTWFGPSLIDNKTNDLYCDNWVTL